MPGPAPALRDVDVADFPALLALNAACVEVLSPMDAARLAHLHAQAARARVACLDGEVIAFLLAFREGADYDSDNYRWFDARYPRFLYVDRVVVAPGLQGRGVGAALYGALFDDARRAGIDLVTCEYDVDPPNPASAAFHARFGFREVGTQVLAGGKRVSLQAVTVGSG